MKRGISILLILMIIFLTASGCSKSIKGDKKGTEATSAETVETSTGTDSKGSDKSISSSGSNQSAKGSTVSGTKANSQAKATPETLINEFINKLYTIEDYRAIDLDALNTRFPNDSYTSDLLKLGDEKALALIINDRIQLIYVTACMYSHINIKVSSIKVEKYSTAEDGSDIYNYNAKLKLTFPNEKNKTKEEAANGQLALKQIDGKWKITQVCRADTENVVEKYMNK